jgi:hypothetical protein
MGTPVAMKADTTRRPLLPACARALRMKGTRHLCQVAVKIFKTADLMPSWASEIISLRPSKARRPSIRSLKRTGPRGPGGQATPGELAENVGPEGLGLRSADRHAEHFVPAVGVDANGDDHGDRDPEVPKAASRLGVGRCGRSGGPSHRSHRSRDRASRRQSDGPGRRQRAPPPQGGKPPWGPRRRCPRKAWRPGSSRCRSCREP